MATLESERCFSASREGGGRLARFQTPGDLVSFLNSHGGSLDEKDEIYRALVASAQEETGWTELATTVLWLGLWPGLDAIYGRNLRFFRGSPEDLVSELSGLFTAAVHRADLSRIHRVAATLVRNTERELRVRLRRTWAENRQLVDLPSGDHFDTDAHRSPSWASPSPPPDDSGDLRRWLRRLLGADAGLVEAVLLDGYTQKEAGARLGLSHAAARKKYQRALERLSHSVSSFGVFPLKGVRR